MRNSLARVRKWDSQPRFKFVVTYRQGGKRRVRYFMDEKSAKLFANEKTIELLNEGRRNGELTAEERRAIAVAHEAGISLKDAVEHYLRHVESLAHSATVEAAVQEFLSIREAEGKSLAHLDDLRQRLARFVRPYGSRLAAEITTKELDGWLHGLAVGPQTRMNFRRVVHNFFTFCTARGYCAGNPVTQASKPKVPPSANRDSLAGTRPSSALGVCAADCSRRGNRLVRGAESVGDCAARLELGRPREAHNRSPGREDQERKAAPRGRERQSRRVARATPPRERTSLSAGGDLSVAVHARVARRGNRAMAGQCAAPFVRQLSSHRAPGRGQDSLAAWPHRIEDAVRALSRAREASGCKSILEHFSCLTRRLARGRDRQGVAEKD